VIYVRTCTRRVALIFAACLAITPIAVDPHRHAAAKDPASDLTRAASRHGSCRMPPCR